MLARTRTDCQRHANARDRIRSPRLLDNEYSLLLLCHDTDCRQSRTKPIRGITTRYTELILVMPFHPFPTTRFRILGVTHFIVGFLLFPYSLVFGFPVALLFAVGPLWIMALGVLLWRPSPRVLSLLRRTHIIGAVIAVLLSVHGIQALRAAARSAAEGGGLLGGYGLIPIALGLLLGTSSMVSLIVARSVREAGPQ